jgi:hypothetical protein
VFIGLLAFQVLLMALLARPLHRVVRAPLDVTPSARDSAGAPV